MSQATINSNGHTNGHSSSPSADPVTSPERRQTAASPSVSPETLVGRHVDNARRQLAEARERLKAARRRVVQLEDALCNWERFAAELRQPQHRQGPSA